MKKLDEVAIWKDKMSEQSRQATLDTVLQNQIEAYEKIMESNVEHVKSIMAYNTCAGLIEQLKYYSMAAFQPPEYHLIGHIVGNEQEVNFESIREYPTSKAGNLFGNS